MIGRLTAPKGHDGGHLRAKDGFCYNRPTVKHKRQCGKGPVGLRNTSRLLSASVRRLAPFKTRLKSRQSTSKGGVLSAKGEWVGGLEFQRKRRGREYGLSVGSLNGGEGNGEDDG